VKSILYAPKAFMTSGVVLCGSFLVIADAVMFTSVFSDHPASLSAALAVNAVLIGQLWLLTWRLAWSVEIDSDTIAWRFLSSTHRAPLDQIRRVRGARLLLGLEVVEVGGHPSAPVM